MSASGVYVQRFDGPSESKMDLTASQSDIGSVKKGKTCNGLTKVLGFVAFLALAVAVAACVALVVIVHRQDEIKARYDNITAKLDAQAQKPPVKPPVKTTTKPPTTVPVDNTVCLTPQCAVTAARVYEALDLSVNPCDNFFDYACGNWIRKHPIPEDRSSVSTFGVLSDELSVTLKALLEMESTDDEIEAVTKAKDLYKSCINEDLIEEMGAKPLMNYLESNYGHWPMTNSSWDPDSFDLVDVLISIRQFGSTPIMYQGVSTDLKNSSYRILELDQPYLLMPGRDYYLSKANDSLPALRAYITSLAEALGASDSAQLAQDVEDVLEFETKVANLTIPAEQRRDPESLYNLFTIRELYTNISDKFDWFKFQRSVMSQEGVGINITEDEPLIVYSPVYLKNVVELVANTPKRTLANYILTGEVMSVVTALPKKFRDIRAEYVKVLFGVQSQSARWRTCVGSAAGSLSNAVGRLFVDSSFDEDAKDIADDMISTIRTSFGGLLKELDWMDDATRGVAKIKANAMREFIGYSEKDIKNDTALNEKYKYVTYHPEKYFENIISNAKQGTIEGLKKLRERIDKTEWISPPAVVNAFYSSTRNSITFPAGILQPPFFWKYYPKSMNYGGIGVVIGHEITHGFDDRGREFDKDGDLKQWWSDPVIQHFKAKAQCIVEQYGNYTVPEADMLLNGINTQGENIADNGGVRQSFAAYRHWVETEGREEQKLPGLDFTHNQLFFLNFAQIWCNAMRPQSAVNRVLTGVHSPGRFRVIGVLQNSPDFAEAFNCPKTSYMNPPKKCTVW